MRSVRNRLRSDSGVTLTELLIVMAIFGILVTALFFIFGQIRTTVAATGATRQLQEVLLTARRDSINNAIPQDFSSSGDILSTFNLQYYEVALDLEGGTGDSGGNFYVRANYNDLSTGTNLYFPSNPRPLKKSEYNNIKLLIEDQTGCSSANVSGLFYIRFDAITSNMSFDNDENPANATNLSGDECRIKFSYETTFGEIRRDIVINKRNKTFKIES